MRLPESLKEEIVKKPKLNITIFRNHLENDGNLTATIEQWGFYGKPYKIAELADNLISPEKLAEMVLVMYPDAQIKIDVDYVD